MGLQDKAPRFKGGAPKYIRSYLDDLADYAESQRPVEDVGIVVLDAPGGGKSIGLASLINGGGLPYYTPFQVVTRAKLGNNNTVEKNFQFAVIGGNLNLTATPNNNTEDITGLPTPTQYGQSKFFTWYDWNGDDDYVYINITNIDFTQDDPLSGATYKIFSKSQGGMFDNTVDAWQSNAYVIGTTNPDIEGLYVQTELNYLLAYLNKATPPNTQNAPVLIQQVFTHLLIGNFGINGSPAIYPVPA